jgi:LPXTG-site transpeptidase (sortase) family protein
MSAIDDTLHIKPMAPPDHQNGQGSGSDWPPAAPRPDAEAARAKIAALEQAYDTAHPILAGLTATPVPPAAPSQPAASAITVAQPPAAASAYVLPTPSSAPAARPALQSAAPASMPAPKPVRLKRPLPSRVRPIVSALASFGLLFLLFKSPVIISELKYLVTPRPDTVATANQSVVETAPPNPLVTIPKINVNAPIVFTPTNAEAAIQKDLQQGVVHYANTALPGQAGNTVIFGHSSNDWWEPGNYKFVFLLLDKLIIGDRLSVNYNSRKYIYEVTNVKVVEPSDLSVLRPQAQPTLTLITCTPPGTSWKRLVVTARQVSPAPAAATAAPEAAQPVATKLPSSAPSFTTQISQFWSGLRHLFSQ